MLRAVHHQGLAASAPHVPCGHVAPLPPTHTWSMMYTLSAGTVALHRRMSSWSTTICGARECSHMCATVRCTAAVFAAPGEKGRAGAVPVGAAPRPCWRLHLCEHLLELGDGGCALNLLHEEVQGHVGRHGLRVGGGGCVCPPKEHTTAARKGWSCGPLGSRMRLACTSVPGHVARARPTRTHHQRYRTRAPAAHLQRFKQAPHALHAQGRPPWHDGEEHGLRRADDAGEVLRCGARRVSSESVHCAGAASTSPPRAACPRWCGPMALGSSWLRAEGWCGAQVLGSARVGTRAVAGCKVLLSPGGP